MNEMRITRTIWPVGHGAFYTEYLRFHNPNSLVTIVYDCGAKTEAIIKNNINVFLKSLRKINNGKPIVDCLAISHFHKDHVNGLQYILSEANVRHLILPQFSEKALVEAFVYNALHTEDTEDTTKCDINSPIQQLIYDVVHNGYSSFNKVEQIIEVQSKSVSKPKVVELYDKEKEIEKEHGLKRIRSGTRLVVAQVPFNNTTNNNNPRWILVPINLGYPKETFKALLKDLKELSKKEGCPPIYTGNYKVNWDNLKELLKNVSLSKVRKCYEIHFDKNNAYSMPMYSGWENPSFVLNEKHSFENYSTLWHRDFLPWICYGCRNLVRVSEDYTWFERPSRQDYRLFQCLYMGDFETKTKECFDELFKQLGPLWTEIGLQQIPHHVSENNHNSNLYKGLHKICFGNIDDAKDRSCSHHVLKSIYRNGCLPLLVTEEDCCLVFSSTLDC